VLRVEGLGIGFRVNGLGFRVDGLAFNVEVRVRVSRVEGLGFKGLMSRVEGWGSRVKGLGIGLRFKGLRLK